MSFLASFVPNEIYFQVRAFHHIYSITSGLALDCGVQMRQLQGCPKPLPIGVSKNCPFTQSDFACDSLTMRCAALRSSQRFCVCASASPLGFQCHNCHNSTSYCQLLPVTLVIFVIFVILVILHAGSMPAISCRLAFIKYCAGMGEKWFAVGAGRISLQI